MMIGSRAASAAIVAMIIMLAVFLVCWVVLTQTRFGRYVFAIGNNPEVTRLAGVPIDRYVVAVYAISGLLAALGASIIPARRAAHVDPAIVLQHE